MPKSPAVCTEIANFLTNSSERMGAWNHLHPGRRRRLIHSAPTAFLPCQELTIRHAKQVLYMNLAKVSPWENTTKTN